MSLNFLSFLYLLFFLFIFLLVGVFYYSYLSFFLSLIVRPFFLSSSSSLVYSYVICSFGTVIRMTQQKIDKKMEYKITRNLATKKGEAKG